MKGRVRVEANEEVDEDGGDRMVMVEGEEEADDVSDEDGME